MKKKKTFFSCMKLTRHFHKKEAESERFPLIWKLKKKRRRNKLK